jgi:hypothetical protein
MITREELDKLKKHVKDLSKIKDKSNWKGLDFDASLNLDVADKLLSHIEKLEAVLAVAVEGLRRECTCSHLSVCEPCCFRAEISKIKGEEVQK